MLERESVPSHIQVPTTNTFKPQVLVSDDNFPLLHHAPHKVNFLFVWMCHTTLNTEYEKFHLGFSRINFAFFSSCKTVQVVRFVFRIVVSLEHPDVTMSVTLLRASIFKHGMDLAQCHFAELFHFSQFPVAECHGIYKSPNSLSCWIDVRGSP